MMIGSSSGTEIDVLDFGFIGLLDPVSLDSDLRLLRRGELVEVVELIEPWLEGIGEEVSGTTEFTKEAGRRSKERSKIKEGAKKIKKKKKKKKRKKYRDCGVCS